MTPPERGFPESEFEERVDRFQRRMAQDRCDAVILTTEAEIRYFSGFLTQFWQSPTRPWFLVVPAAGGSLGNEVGRLGHGLGMELTEPPSNTQDDGTVLEAGMVLTLESGMVFAPGREMVHEENIVITVDGAEWLIPRAAEELPVIAG